MTTEKGKEEDLLSAVTNIDAMTTSIALPLGREETGPVCLHLAVHSTVTFEGLAGEHSTGESHSHHSRPQLGGTKIASELEIHRGVHSRVPPHSIFSSFKAAPAHPNV